MKRWLCLLLSLLLLMQLCGTLCRADTVPSPEDNKLHALGACLMDGDSGRVLYGKNENDELAMASTTKIMTCILIMENCDPDEIVTASQYAADQPKVHLGVSKGQRFLLEDLLFALMLESYNDAAVMLAEHLDGTVEAFAERMNLKAEQLGCRQTHFVTPNGLDGSDKNGDHHTTAADLARIMRYCVNGSEKAEYFQELTKTESHAFSDLDRQSAYFCKNHNQLLFMTEGVLSGKTGFTGKAGYCYVCAVRKDGRTFVISLLGCGWPNNKTYKWQDTLKLLSYGSEAFSRRRPKAMRFENSVAVDLAVYPWGESQITQRVTIREQAGNEQAVLMKEDETVKAVYTYRTEVTAPVFAGTQIGQVTYILGDMSLGSNPIIVTQDIRAVSFGWCAKRMTGYFLWKKPDT